MKRRVRVADLFCGAGGSSTGAHKAFTELGLEMDLVAVNHWSVAIDTHSRNHPHARHLCVDVYKTKPREAVLGGKLDLLMASPTCTFHSRARGGRPISWDQRYGRMTPTQVVRWLTDLDVKCLLVENVPEFVNWSPVNRLTGKPVCKKRGMYFRAWVRRIVRLGYWAEWRILNAADYGDVTTRKRFFLIARKDRKPIRWPEPSHSRHGSHDLFGGGQQRWRAAREIIDWSLLGRSIFKREKPLSLKTLARIYAGAMRFGWPESFLVVLRRHMDAQSLDAPLPTICAGGNHVGLAQSLILPQGGGGAARSVDKPLATITTDGAHALVAPYNRTANARPVSQPLPTQTTRDRFGLVVPVTHQDASNRSRSLEQPLPSITGAHRGELAFIVAAFGERPTQAPRVHSVDAPAPTICAKGRVQFVEGARQEAQIDILFRMLQPHELAAAMGFCDAETSYEFCGTKEEVTRQIGNAVPVRTASALVKVIFGDK